jgi:TRAP transporter 4TM/12TM fusion protein
MDPLTRRPKERVQPAEIESRTRDTLPRRLDWIVTGLLALVPLLALAAAFRGISDPVGWRALHLLMVIPPVFVLYPGSRRSKGRMTIADWSLAAAAIAAFAWIFIDRERIVWRMTYVDPVPATDLAMGILAIVVILEATRRTLGLTLVLVTLAFLAYAIAGPLMPAMLQHKGIPITLLVEHLYLVPEGIFNVIVGIMSTYLLTFLLFGTLLRFAGGDEIFMNMTLAMAGKSPGGPAKAAVIGSGLMGSISGSTIANVLTTGQVTIPLMKRAGFRPYEAAAIESAASMGGAMMPPVMGAGVFVMSELTGIPLITIMLYSVIPAVLYFAAIYAYVHIKAHRGQFPILPQDAGRTRWLLFVAALPLLVPIAALVYLLLRNYTPFLASAVTCVLLFVLSYVRQETRLTPNRVLRALTETTRSAMMLSATGASAGIIMGVITITGLMQKVSSIVLGLADGSVAIGVLLTGSVSLLLGLGLPVTSAYIIISVLGVSALTELGLSTLAAHLTIFWFSQSATITPPVCMTAFVAASIADAPPMRTGFEACRVAKALYLMPFLFAYAHFLEPPVWRILIDAAGALLGLTLIPAVLEGWWGRLIGSPARLALAAAAIIAFVATFSPSAGRTIGWLAVAVAIAGLAYVFPRRPTTTVIEPGRIGEAAARSPTAIP